VTSTLTDSDLLSNVPKLGEPKPEEIQRGRQLFTDKGCAGCHILQGISPAKDFGPDLSALGAKTVSQLEFGGSAVPRNLISYIRAKISDPLSVNKAARMPQYSLPPQDLVAVTTALLSMKGTVSSTALEKLVVPAPRPEFHPAGEFGELFQRFQCAQCHRFNGYGGTLAPDLSFEGSRVQRAWLVQFLKNPQTLRTTLTYRMPEFNITDQEANVLASYISLVLQSPTVNPQRAEPEHFTPAQSAMGKELYEVKYQCQNCHTIGSTGGYVGPSMNNIGNWMNAGWIGQWLRDPQSLVPGAVEPKRSFTEEEVKALTAYLVKLRQAPGSKMAMSGGGGK
jgi:mono/diheme cytochrome c family protein